MSGEVLAWLSVGAGVLIGEPDPKNPLLKSNIVPLTITQPKL